MAFVLFWLPLTVYATALCLARNSANDPSVIYPSVYTKAAPVTPSGLRDDLGAVPSGEGPQVCFWTAPLWKITKNGWNFAP
jgi:hypothetical protein